MAFADPGLIGPGPYTTVGFLDGQLTVMYPSAWESHEDQGVEFSSAIGVEPSRERMTSIPREEIGRSQVSRLAARLRQTSASTQPTVTIPARRLVTWRPRLATSTAVATERSEHCADDMCVRTAIADNIQARPYDASH